MADSEQPAGPHHLNATPHAGENSHTPSEGQAVEGAANLEQTAQVKVEKATEQAAAVWSANWTQQQAYAAAAEAADKARQAGRLPNRTRLESAVPLICSSDVVVVVNRC